MVNQLNSESFLCVANWKMNGDANLCKNLTDLYAKQAANSSNKVVIAPPFPYLSAVLEAKGDVKLAAQNCYEQVKGAYTGEVSPAMLKDLGCSYVILGHSERREHLGEDNQLVSRKAFRAIEQGLVPIICVGETLQQREAGETLSFLSSQLAGSIPENAKPSNCIIAYEPVWAIGTGIVPTNKQIEEVHTHIKRQSDMPVIYGGSVNATNIEQIKSIDSVSGVLVGGASLKEDEFIKIINS